MEEFILGTLAMASGVIGLFFLRYWRDTNDRLFAIFAFAFWLFGVTRVLMAILGESSENRNFLYLLRLAGFVLIIIAVVDKNRTAARKE
jgi:uncharacterized membrane protein HdeD (DUF308 family)